MPKNFARLSSQDILHRHLKKYCLVFRGWWKISRLCKLAWVGWLILQNVTLNRRLQITALYKAIFHFTLQGNLVDFRHWMIRRQVFVDLKCSIKSEWHINCLCNVLWTVLARFFDRTVNLLCHDWSYICCPRSTNEALSLAWIRTTALFVLL